MRQIKNTIIDNMFLLTLFINENNKLIVKDVEINDLIKRDNVDFYKPDYKFFLSMNPQKDISKTKLKESFAKSYQKYLHYKNGKKYRNKAIPFDFTMVLEERDDKIKFNHLHILTENLSIYDMQIFQSILYLYLSNDFENLSVYGEDSTINTIGYMLKKPDSTIYKVIDLF